MDKIILVQTNLPDRESAERLAHASIENRVAACVNILAECTSIYRWQGKVETVQEVPLLIKTTREVYPRLQMVIGAYHPYEFSGNYCCPYYSRIAGLSAMGETGNDTSRNGRNRGMRIVRVILALLLCLPGLAQTEGFFDHLPLMGGKQATFLGERHRD